MCARSEKKVTVRETEKMSGQWMTPAAIGQVRAALESWAEIVYDNFVINLGRSS